MFAFITRLLETSANSSASQADRNPTFICGYFKQQLKLQTISSSFHEQKLGNGFWKSGVTGSRACSYASIVLNAEHNHQKKKNPFIKCTAPSGELSETFMRYWKIQVQPSRFISCSSSASAQMDAAQMATSALEFVPAAPKGRGCRAGFEAVRGRCHMDAASSSSACDRAANRPW